MDEDEFTGIVAVVARQVASRFRGYVEPNELVAEAWIWRLERPAKWDAIGEMYDDAKERSSYVARCVRNAAELYARRQKAAVLGYDPEDEGYYTSAQLKAVLPDVYDHGAWVSYNGPSEPVRVHGDPAEGGSHLAALADVSRALGRLSTYDQGVLQRVYRDGLTAQQATGGELSDEGARSRVARAVGRLRRELGGPRPFADPAEHTGSRSVVSNASAQAMTEAA